MVYKTFVLKTLVSLFLFILLYGLIVYFLYERPISTNWIEQCYKIKDDKARSIQTSKIVFTAGSNVLMGINTEQIEKVLKIPTVNHGVHFLLGTDYIIYRTKQILKRGDTVVMPMEYANITWDGQVTDTLAGYILTNDKNYLSTLSLLKQMMIIYSITPGKFYKVLLTKIPTIKRKLLKSGYSANTLNSNGDETDNINKKGIYKSRSTGFSKPKDDLLEYRGLRSIIEFSKWCKTNGVQFYFQYPNMLQIGRSDQKNYSDFQKQFEKILLSNDIQVLGTPEDSFFKRKYLYDTKYHLNQDGMSIRSQRFIDSILDLGIKL